MHKLFFAMLAAAMICVAAPGARAEVPTLIPVVGVFADADDAPLEGSYQVVFTLYSAQTGGMTLWGETQQVTFTDGLFRVYLGSTSVDGMDITDFIDNDSVWLGVKVGADGEMNRVRLASVPWAFEAETCREVADLPSAGIQSAIGAAACGANQAMRGWSGSAAVCVDLPSTAGLVANTDIGVTVQAPISQAQPCNYGIGEITAGGAVTCVPDREVVRECGPEAAGGSLNNYLGSDGVCHPAPHSCTANQYLAGGAAGACQEAPHKCTANQYLDGDGSCQEAPHKCTANQYLDGDGTCRTGVHSCAANQVLVASGSGGVACVTAGFGLMPIGSIAAWNKSMTGVPSLPSGWVECNGQTLSDAGSPLNGQVIPDLNNAVSAGLKGRFLRGNTTSGVVESDLVRNHNHPFTEEGFSPNSNCWSSDSCSGGYVGYEQTHNRTTDSSGGLETRPYNYSVVWIMRVK
jgi:hypothetical protein